MTTIIQMKTVFFFSTIVLLLNPKSRLLFSEVSSGVGIWGAGAYSDFGLNSKSISRLLSKNLVLSYCICPNPVTCDEVKLGIP